jgi:hypothetical protein
MRNQFSLLVVAASFLVAPASGSAQSIIDFEELGTSPTTRVWPSYSIGDFLLSNSGPAGFAAWGTQSANYPGSVALLNNNLGEWTTLSTLSGSSFAIFSISLAHLRANLMGSENVVDFTGIRLDGTMLFQSFVIPASTGGSPVLHAFAFSNSFRDLQSLTWQQTPNYHQFDNIVLVDSSATVTPEPISMALLGTGLAGVAIARRRRRNAISTTM